jgi:hypothetical protein
MVIQQVAFGKLRERTLHYNVFPAGSGSDDQYWVIYRLCDDYLLADRTS